MEGKVSHTEHELHLKLKQLHRTGVDHNEMPCTLTMLVPSPEKNETLKIIFFLISFLLHKSLLKWLTGKWCVK